MGKKKLNHIVQNTERYHLSDDANIQMQSYIKINTTGVDPYTEDLLEK